MFLVYVVVIALAAGAGTGATLVTHALARRGAAVRQVAARSRMNEGAVYRRVEPSVVDVTADLKYLDETAEGTGFVFDAARGYVLTNNHVIDDAVSVSVTSVRSGKRYQARVVGYDRAADIAVLRLTGARGLTAATFGDSGALRDGAKVLALGNRGGRGGPPAVTSGVISSTSRSIVASDASSGLTETLHGMLQTSADIQPGDSGGPLVDVAGHVVGIDTAAGDGGPGKTFAGYAIPINVALAVARKIVAGQDSGQVWLGPVHLGMPAFLGVLLPDPKTGPGGQAGSGSGKRAGKQDGKRAGSQDLAGAREPASRCLSAGISGNLGTPPVVAQASRGALVTGVVCGSPAARAGLAAGDMVVSFGGRPVSSASVLRAALHGLAPGAHAELGWVAPGGGKRITTVTLSIGPAG